MNSSNFKKMIYKNIGILSLVLPLSLLLNPFSAFASTETIQYAYKDSRQITKAIYDDGTEVDYAYDGSGNRIAKTIIFAGAPANNPPTSPSNLSPADSATDVDRIVTLSWTSSSDPDAGDIVFYDIYFGTTSPPPLYKSGHNSTSYTPLTLNPLTTYYWKIAARDNHNATTEGVIWSFTTKDNVYPVANPSGPYSSIEGQAIMLDGSGSSDSDGTIELYEWDIDNDGTYDYSSSSPAQSHTYAQQGIYTIRLRVTDDLGATDEATTTADISDTSPTADFTGSPTNGAAPLTVIFVDGSTGYDQPLSYEWDFDNNGTVDSNDSNPSYTYNNQGTYTVKLIVTDSDGSTNILIKIDYITVTCSNPPVRIGGTYYSTLQFAYDAAVDGDTIQSQAALFIEDLNIDRDISVIIEGGYDCTYTTKIGKTRLKGTITLNSGTLTIGDFILEN